MDRQKIIREWPRVNNTLVSKDSMHGGSINSMCREQKFPIIEFTDFTGTRYAANCILTACAFLKETGQYKQEQLIPVIWH